MSNAKLSHVTTEAMGLRPCANCPHPRNRHAAHDGHCVECRRECSGWADGRPKCDCSPYPNHGPNAVLCDCGEAT